MIAIHFLLCQGLYRIHLSGWIIVAVNDLKVNFSLLRGVLGACIDIVKELCLQIDQNQSDTHLFFGALREQGMHCHCQAEAHYNQHFFWVHIWISGSLNKEASGVQA